MSRSFGLAPKELSVLRRLATPAKVQDFLELLPYNFEPRGDTCRSPRTVLRERTAHCIEGAMLAAAAFRLQGRRPLVLDLEASAHDQDHVIAVFREKTGWGAVSKTNHAVLRYRDPVYRTIRELVMSYFHEYTDSRGRKSLRTYSRPVDLSRFDPKRWMTSEEDVWFVPEYLVQIPHQRIISTRQAKTLRPLGAFEGEMGEYTEWKKPRA